MIDLLSRFEEVKDPKIRAENHKKDMVLSIFKERCRKAVAEVKRATEEFSENNTYRSGSFGSHTEGSKKFTFVPE